MEMGRPGVVIDWMGMRGNGLAVISSDDRVTVSFVVG